MIDRRNTHTLVHSGFTRAIHSVMPLLVACYSEQFYSDIDVSVPCEASVRLLIIMRYFWNKFTSTSYGLKCSFIEFHNNNTLSVPLAQS